MESSQPARGAPTNDWTGLEIRCAGIVEGSSTLAITTHSGNVIQVRPDVARGAEADDKAQKMFEAWKSNEIHDPMRKKAKTRWRG